MIPLPLPDGLPWDRMGPYPLWWTAALRPGQRGPVHLDYHCGEWTPALGAVATKLDSNRWGFGNEHFVIYEIRSLLPATIPLADAKTCLDSLSLEVFCTGRRPLMEGSVALFPSNGGLDGSAGGRCLAAPIATQPRRCRAVLFWQGALEIMAPQKITIILDGMRERPARGRARHLAEAVYEGARRFRGRIRKAAAQKEPTS